jgi:hypothetical protein
MNTTPLEKKLIQHPDPLTANVQSELTSTSQKNDKKAVGRSYCSTVQESK